MDGRDLVRSVKMVGSVQGLRTVRTAWRHRRADARALPPRGAERARVPGLLTGAEPGPGGGVVRFARSELRVRVAAGGAVFWAWDGAEALPSYALPGPEPEPDPRAALEPDKDGGWQVVSERLTVAVSRHGAIELRTPGGLVLRRELPPRWWEPVAGGAARWVQRSEVPADARFFGLGGLASGARLREGTYRLWNPGPGDEPGNPTMPVHLVVSDAGTHVFFHDNAWAGQVRLCEGEEGAGSGHDRPGTCEVRMDGGPLRCWVVAGTPARVLRGWTALTGAPALPPSWALGAQHGGPGSGGGEEGVRRVVAGYRERGLPLSVVHVGSGRGGAQQVFGSGRERFPGLPRLAKELREDGVRLVAAVGPAVSAEPGDAVFDGGQRVGTAGAYVRDAGGRVVRGSGRQGESVCPDFTDPLVREWWGGLYEEPLEQGFSGVWHEPGSSAGGRRPALPLSARYALEGRGGDHREAHNVYGLAMARAGYEGVRRLRPDERPFVVSRSGWAGVQRYGGVRSGAGTAGWPGLRASLALVLGLGLCGVPYAGVGGGGAEESDELYVRRLQLGAFLPLFRVGADAGGGSGGGFGGRSGGRVPWESGPRVLEYAKAAFEGRARLHPYFVTLAQVARLTGAPYVRPLWWAASGDRTLRDCEDAFLLGDALLVAPVLECGTERRAVRLPRGRWYDTATGEAYEGPGQVLVDAPLSRIPVLARAGAVIPVRGAEGGLELEAWAPRAGRTGRGLVVRDAGDGWARSAVERFTSRMADGQVVVEREGGEEGADLPPLRVRGL